MFTRCSTSHAVRWLLAGLTIAGSLVAPGWSQEIVLMPNETLCGQDYVTNGVIVKASHFVSSQKYFSCDIKLKPQVEINTTYQWVLRIERVFIPYTTAAFAPAIIIHSTDEIRIIDYIRDFSNYSGMVLSSRRLILQFVNLPRDADYKFVITLDSGESNCSSGYRCIRTGYCIERGLVCDSEDHCGDGSDESEDLCPQATHVASIAIIAGGSAMLALLVGLAVFLVVRCSRKTAATTNDRRRQDALARMGKRVTYIRSPGRSQTLSISSSGAGASLQRHSGIGYRPAPIVFKNSFAAARNDTLPLSNCAQENGDALAALPV